MQNGISAFAARRSELTGTVSACSRKPESGLINPPSLSDLLATEALSVDFLAYGNFDDGNRNL